MSAHLFDTHSPTCPICHRAGAVKPHKLITGLLTCQYCRERLVVSCSGHYVRDPFTLNLAAGHRLRRQSRPYARMWRDLQLTPYPLILGLLGSAIFFWSLVAVLRTNPPDPVPQDAPPTLQREESDRPL